MSGGKSVKFAEDPPKKAWQDSLSTSSKALSFLLSTGMLSDITFAVGPEGKQFRVHRLILATRSPVFEELLVSDPRYSSCDDVIPIRDDSSAGFHWLMQHIYCDRADIDNIDMVLQVLALSEKYMVASAYDCCIRFLKTSVKRNNVLSLYSYLITSYSDNQALFTMCRKICEENSNSVLMSSALHKLPAIALSSLLQESLAVTSEVVIFKAVVSWGNAQLKSRGLPVSPSNLRREVDQFIKDIRFFTMSSEEFVQNVLVADLLTPDESVVALKHIARPDSQVVSSDLHNSGIKLSPRRDGRPQLITKEHTYTCNCEGITRSWLKHRTYEFHMTVSDNIVLLAYKFQVQGHTNIQVDVSKGDAPHQVLGSAETHNNLASFMHPVHMRESVDYVVRITAAGDAAVLFGAEHSAATCSEAGITITLAPGVFVQAVVFV